MNVVKNSIHAKQNIPDWN